MFFNPLEQFEIVSLLPFKLVNFDFSLTNSTFFVIMALVGLRVLLLFFFRFQIVISTRWQVLIENFYAFLLASMVNTIISGYKAQANFPFVYITFMNNFATNLIGMTPYSFTSSSHLIVTFYTASIIYFGSNFKGLIKHGVDLADLVLPDLLRRHRRRRLRQRR